nr:MAG TPA: hypothetical protein [Caudoviricetes sp.]
MENYFQKFGSHDKEGGHGISSLFLKNRPSPPPDFNLSQPSIPLFNPFLLHYPFHCSTTTTNNKKHAHTSNKRYILAREHWEQKKETDKIIIISSASYHDK